MACPSPMSTTPAFSPGPWMTRGPVVGSVLSQVFDDLYEQCSFHIADTIPSSVKVGSRPMSLKNRSYSSGFNPCSSTTSGVILSPTGCISAGKISQLDHFDFRHGRYPSVIRQEH